MAKVKEITLGGSYTFQAAPYTPIKGESQVTMVVEEGDDIEDVQSEAALAVVQNIVAMIAGVNVIHDKLHVKGMSVEAFLSGEEEDDEEEWLAGELDDKEDWGIDE